MRPRHLGILPITRTQRYEEKRNRMDRHTALCSAESVLGLSSVYSVQPYRAPGAPALASVVKTVCLIHRERAITGDPTRRIGQSCLVALPISLQNNCHASPFLKGRRGISSSGRVAGRQISPGPSLVKRGVEQVTIARREHRRSRCAIGASGAVPPRGRL